MKSYGVNHLLPRMAIPNRHPFPPKTVFAVTEEGFTRMEHGRTTNDLSYILAQFPAKARG
jgi:hypothetical protein